MKNIVPCKMCSTEFEYIPGFSGRNRQVCVECLKIQNDEKLKKFAEDSILEDNKYLIEASGYQTKYDAVDILVSGEFPQFNSDGERFTCAYEIGTFLKNQNGFSGTEDNFIKFLNHLGNLHSIVCLQLLSVQMVNKVTQMMDKA